MRAVSHLIPSRISPAKSRLGAVALGVLLAQAAFAQTPTPTPTPSPTPTPFPTAVLFPASNLLYGVPNGGRYDAANLVIDPAGAVWSASATENTVARLSADRATITRWTFPKDAAPSSLLREPDGTFWVTELGGFKVGKFDPATGKLKEWPDAGRRPTALVKISEGKFWLPETGGALAQFDSVGNQFTYHTVANSNVRSLSYPYVDEAGAIWTSDFASGTILRYTPDASKVTRWTLPNIYVLPSKVVRGPDDKLWFSFYGSGQLARFDPATNELRTYDLVPGSLPYDLKIYRGRILYSEQIYGEIGLFDPKTYPVSATTVLTPEEFDTVSTVIASTPSETTLTSKDDAPTLLPPAGISGNGYPGLVTAPASPFTIWGLEVDLVRQRVWFGTSGNIGQLRPPLPQSDDDWVVPSAASIGGAGGVRWKTESVLWNKGTPDSSNATKPLEFTQRLLLTDWILGFPIGSVGTIAAGALFAQTDAIGDALAAPDNSGALRFVPNGTTGVATDLYAWARTSRSREDGGTYGFAANAVKGTRALKAGETGFLFAPPDADGQRVNAGLFVLEDAKGTISILDANGAVVGAPYAFDWPSGYHRQFSTIFAALGVAPVPNARISYALSSGKILPFGTSIHDGTSDPVGLAAFLPTDASGFQWIPSARKNADVTTDLQLYNSGTTDAQVSFDFTAADPFGTESPSLRLFASATVPAGKTVVLRDVLGTVLGLPSGSGTLFIGSDKPLFAFARITGGPAGARFGWGVPAMDGRSSAGPETRAVFLAAGDTGWDVMETQLAIYNSFETAATATLRATFADGTAAGTRDVTIPPKSTRTLDAAFYAISGAGVPYGRLEVLPAAGSPPLSAALVRRDNKTGDADLIPPFVTTR